MRRTLIRVICAPLLLALLASMAAPGRAAEAGKLTVAAAASLTYAMDQIVAAYRKAHPGATIDLVYGASGKLTVQIQQSAPFDVLFAADTDFPRKLIESHDAVGEPVLYALGQLVMWSASIDLRGVKVQDLVQPRFVHIAIGSPDTAPYGKRAEQALRAAGIWEQVQSRLVFGTDIAQAAQFARTGNAQVGLIAASLLFDPQMQKGSSVPVPPSMYAPLEQSFVVTQHGAGNPLALDFARYVQGAKARAILARNGFGLPPAAH